ncbi:hypothetical protein ACUYQI_000886 [Salmonella enterica subsp. enterica serovar Braenderup]
MAKHTSYRGQTIDMDMMKYQNQTATALGNANMNARGDKIGQGGTVIKTREELLAERERQMQLPDFIPEHTSHSVAVQTADEGFDDSMFELPEQEPVAAPVQPVQEAKEESAKEAVEKVSPRRVRTKKDGE